MVDRLESDGGSPDAWRSRRILLVDDEAVVRRVIRTVLDRPGLYLVEAEDGERAIGLLLAEPFDLIIADKNLPGITGLDVIRRAKAVDKRMGALLITAYASRESAEEAMAIGVDDYLVKPFEMSELLEKVEESLARRREPASTEPLRPSRRKVVVCERDPGTRELLGQALQALGHQPLAVEGLPQVLAALSEARAEAAVCELELFSQDNSTACFLRSRLLLKPGLRMVVVAAERGLRDAVEAIHHGAGHVIYRPLRDPALVAEDLRDYLS